MLSTLLTTLTGGLSSVVTSWKQYLLVTLLSAFGVQSAYLAYVKYLNTKKDQQISKLAEDNVVLAQQLTVVQDKLDLQKKIVSSYAAIQKQAKAASIVASNSTDSVLAELEKLPDNLTDKEIKVINSRLKCELQNFDNVNTSCN